MTRIGKALAAIALIAAACGAGPATAQDLTLYRAGKTNWLAAVYPSAYPPLIDFRAGAYGRTADVDYMLGTSACRIPGRRDWGGRMLNYILYAYALSEPNRRQVIAERDLCRAPAPLAALSTGSRNGLERLVGSRTRSRGKLWYMEGRADAAYPARQLREIPIEDFQARTAPIGEAARARQTLEALKPAGAQVRPMGRFVFVVAAGQTDAELRRLADLLEAYVSFLGRTFGMTPPDRYITIYLMPNMESVRAVANKVHGLDVSPSTLGYTFQDDLSAVAMIQRAEGGTLLHELFHLLVRGSFGDAPQWLDEGYASLYEVSTLTGATFRGEPNWRGRMLTMFRTESPKLATLVASPWFSFDRADRAAASGQPAWDAEYSAEAVAAHLATARYFALYLQQKGKLGDVYQAFQARDPGAADDPGAESVVLVERALGRPMAEVQADYDAWLPTVLKQDRTNDGCTVGKSLESNVVQKSVPCRTGG